MNIPLIFSFCYLVLGMISTTALWSHLQEEIEMAIGLEEDETQAGLRLFLMIVYVIAWPVVLYDVIRKN